MEIHTQHRPEKWFPHKHNPWHKKERNSQAKEQTDHNGEKANKTQTEYMSLSAKYNWYA